MKTNNYYNRNNEFIKLSVVEIYNNTETNQEFNTTRSLFIKKYDIRSVGEVVNINTRKPYKTLSAISLYDGKDYVVRAYPSKLWNEVTSQSHHITVKGFKK